MKIINNVDSGRTFNIAVVVSRFNEEVTGKLLEGCIERLQECGFTDEQITVVWVPGAVELAVAAQHLVISEQYEAVVCLGAVIKGETDHYEYVCQQVSYACQRLSLDEGFPVIFGVLTTQNADLARARAGGVSGNKGRYCADAAIEMVATLSCLIND